MSEPVVTISTGKLLGKTCEDFDGTQFYAFKGIPYAKPPIGNLRFKAPEPIEPWTGVKNAQNDGSECLQFDMVTRKLLGSEDCLNLNVYTREITTNKGKPKPVMVWIHGGAFTTGSNKPEMYGPEHLMTEDIVVVSINYRVNIFGFLNFDDESLGVPGNAGMKDMVLALKWVQTNIKFFNGDPNNVTIFGESAGGAAVHYLVLSPLTKGLFHKAIIQSGVATNLWARGKNCTEEIAEILKINSKKEKDILDRLKEMSGEEIFSVCQQTKEVFLPCVRRPYAPTIEKPSKDAFISEDPLEIMKSGNYNQVPIIIGYTSREGMLCELFLAIDPQNHTAIDFEKMIPYTLNAKDTKNVGQQIKQFYYGDIEPSPENKHLLYIMETDNSFLREIHQAAELHAQTSNKPVYFYRVSLESNFNFIKNLFNIKSPGVCHAEELGYLFKMTKVFGRENTAEVGPDEKLAIRRFVKLWTNFAKKTNPNSDEKDDLINVEWKPVSPNNVYFLDIDKKLTLLENPEKERMDFWKKLYKENA